MKGRFSDPQKLKNVTVFQLDPWDSKDGFGHFWIEVSGKEYGWWPPSSGAGPKEWGTRSVSGTLLAGSDPYTGSYNNTSHRNYNAHTRAYSVYVKDGSLHPKYTDVYITNKLVEVGKNMGGTYGVGCDCRAYVRDVVSSLELHLVKRK